MQLIRRYLRRLATVALFVLIVAGVSAHVATGLGYGAAAAAEADARTELEQLRAELALYKRALVRTMADLDTCRVELAPYRTTANARALEQEEARLRAELEKAHPDMDVDPRTLTLKPKEKKP